MKKFFYAVVAACAVTLACAEEIDKPSALNLELDPSSMFEELKAPVTPDKDVVRELQFYMTRPTELREEMKSTSVIAKEAPASEVTPPPPPPPPKAQRVGVFWKLLLFIVIAGGIAFFAVMVIKIRDRRKQNRLITVPPQTTADTAPDAPPTVQVPLGPKEREMAIVIALNSGRIGVLTRLGPWESWTQEDQTLLRESLPDSDYREEILAFIPALQN